MDIKQFLKRFFEAVKEPLRYLVCLAVSFVINDVLAQLSNTSLSPEWITIVSLILRSIDKFVYQYQKEKLPEGESLTGFKGITGF